MTPQTTPCLTDPPEPSPLYLKQEPLQREGGNCVVQVCFNIVKPLTEAKQISFVELIGPRRMQWFISHYWGMPVRHFAEAVRKHAQSYQRDLDP